MLIKDFKEYTWQILAQVRFVKSQNLGIEIYGISSLKLVYLETLEINNKDLDDKIEKNENQRFLVEKIKNWDENNYFCIYCQDSLYKIISIFSPEIEKIQDFQTEKFKIIPLVIPENAYLLKMMWVYEESLKKTLCWALTREGNFIVYELIENHMVSNITIINIAFSLSENKRN